VAAGDAGRRPSAPVVAGDTVVVATPTALLALQASDGAERWSDERDGAPVAPAIAAVGKTEAVVYTDGRGPDTSVVRAVDLRDGSPLWDAPPSLDDESRTGVTVDETQAYVGDESGNVSAISLVDGTVTWTAHTTGNLGGPVAAGDGIVVAVVAASDDARSASIVAFDAATGEERWSVSPDATATFGSLASITGGAVVVALPDGSVVGLSGDDGSEVWRERIPGLVSPFVAPAIAGESVVVADSNGTVHLVTPGGDRAWVFAFNEPVLRASPVVVSGAALVGFEDGSIGAVALDTGHMVFRSADAAAPVTGLALTPDAVLVTRGGSGRPQVSALVTDRQASLVDEPSPTEPVAADLAIGFALALGVGVAIHVPGRLLARRTPIEDPSVVGADDDVEHDEDEDEDGP
jgi:outer membrane protein assembly factor BamB